MGNCGICKFLCEDNINGVLRCTLNPPVPILIELMGVGVQRVKDRAVIEWRQPRVSDDMTCSQFVAAEVKKYKKLKWKNHPLKNIDATAGMIAYAVSTSTGKKLRYEMFQMANGDVHLRCNSTTTTHVINYDPDISNNCFERANLVAQDHYDAYQKKWQE